MRDPNETIDAIVSELRELVNSGTCGFTYPDDRFSGSTNSVATWVDVLADRIESAAKRLSDAKYCEGWDNCEDTIKAEQKQSATGNAAAMRAVLELLKNRGYVGLDGAFHVPIEDMSDQISAALSAPARNCDRFATAEEAYSAWMQAAELDAICDWLFAPAKEGGAE